jgi:hypothetical protein
MGGCSVTEDMKEITDFATQVDELMYGYDAYDYRDNYDNREDRLSETIREILSGNTEGIQETLEEITEYCNDSDVVDEATRLLVRLPEISNLVNNLDRRVSHASI